jgi:hypothetical protein
MCFVVKNHCRVTLGFAVCRDTSMQWKKNECILSAWPVLARVLLQKVKGLFYAMHGVASVCGIILILRNYV